MLYARLKQTLDGFEDQRNLMRGSTDLDGGGTVTADDSGRVYIAWQGRGVGDPAGEAHRRLWVARSEDDGATFAGERPALEKAIGACACCGTRAMADSNGKLSILFPRPPMATAATSGLPAHATAASISQASGFIPGGSKPARCRAWHSARASTAPWLPGRRWGRSISPRSPLKNPDRRRLRQADPAIASTPPSRSLPTARSCSPGPSPQAGPRAARSSGGCSAHRVIPPTSKAALRAASRSGGSRPSSPGRMVASRSFIEAQSKASARPLPDCEHRLPQRSPDHRINNLGHPYQHPVPEGDLVGVGHRLVQQQLVCQRCEQTYRVEIDQLDPLKPRGSNRAQGCFRVPAVMADRRVKWCEEPLVCWRERDDFPPGLRHPRPASTSPGRLRCARGRRCRGSCQKSEPFEAGGRTHLDPAARGKARPPRSTA